jgi:hypothetical protein
MKIEDAPASPKYALRESHIGYRLSMSVQEWPGSRGRCLTLAAQLGIIPSRGLRL